MISSTLLFYITCSSFLSEFWTIQRIFIYYYTILLGFYLVNLWLFPPYEKYASSLLWGNLIFPIKWDFNDPYYVGFWPCLIRKILITDFKRSITISAIVFLLYETLAIFAIKNLGSRDFIWNIDYYRTTWNFCLSYIASATLISIKQV